MEMNPKIVAIAGGVGGAKLALGLSHLLPSKQLTVVVNTGDDEEFYGLHVSPDLDTMMYTLAGVVNQENGWGLADETFNCLSSLNSYGHDTWFKLGDKDLATHIQRTNLMASGLSLSEVTLILSNSLGVLQRIVPMTDSRVRTMVDTDIGYLSFQEYFVKFQCEPKVKSIAFYGIENSSPSPGFVKSLSGSDVLIFCPSNPYLSIDPILAIPGVRTMLQNFKGGRVAVSPIVGNRALRGPAAKMMTELGKENSCVGVARKYVGLCDIFIIDEIDRIRADEIRALGFNVEILNTVMVSVEDKMGLGQKILEFFGYQEI